MAFISTVNNQAHTIDTGENSDQRNITIDGTTQSIDWRHIASLAADAWEPRRATSAKTMARLLVIEVVMNRLIRVLHSKHES